MRFLAGTGRLHLAIAGLAALGAPFAAGACGDGRHIYGQGGSGGEAGNTGGSGGMGGFAETTAVSTGTGFDADSAAPCYGDAAAWDQQVKTPALCQTRADCCVVFSECLAEAQVVPKAAFMSVDGIWPFCEGSCRDCLPPAVDVGCFNGECYGVLVPMPDPKSVLRMSHCGDDSATPPPPPPPGTKPLHFGCGMM